MNLIGRATNWLASQLKTPPADGDQEKSFSAGYNLPVSGGWLPAGSSWNFWQQGYNVRSGGACAAVHACADAYAQAVATMNVRHIHISPTGGKRIIKTSQPARVLRNPNKYQTSSDFFMNLIKDLMLSGKAFAVAQRDERDRIVELHQFPSMSTQPMVEPETQEIYYALGNNPLGGDVEALVPDRDVLHLRLHTPSHPLIGVSPVVNLASSIVANGAITNHQAAFFENMSRPSGIISTDQILNKQQMTQLREAWEDQAVGLNSGRIPILNAGMKFQPMTINSQDAQLVQAFNMTVEEIARAFRVPLPLVGDNRHATYNNVEQLVSSWLAMGLGFVVEHVEKALDKFFGLTVNYQIEFDVDRLMRMDFEGRIKALTSAIQGGLYSPNEAREREMLPRVDFGDEPRLQAQVVPLSRIDAAPAESAPSAPSAVDEDSPLSEEEQRDLAVLQLKKALVS